MTINHRMGNDSDTVRRVTLTTNPTLVQGSKVAYMVVGLDLRGFQWQILLDVLPTGLTLDMIKAGQQWFIERRTTYNRLYMYCGSLATTGTASGTITFSGGLGAKTSVQPGYYANFYSTSNQTAAAINTPYPITHNIDAGSYGFVLGSGSNTSRIYAQNAGTYNFQFSLQITNSNTTGNSYSNASIWTRQNGVDIPWSAGEISAGNKNPNVLPAWNNIIVMASGDYVQYMWAVDSTTVYILAQSNPIYGPSIPSVTVTATQL